MFFMKIAKARENKEENKGFSLVELIIVMAIMVALVAVMAPQFIKYVQRSRDAVVTDAAENILSCVKTEIALGHIKYSSSGNSTIYVSTNGDGNVKYDSSGATTGQVGLTASNITIDSTADYYNTDSDTAIQNFFYDFCGVDSTKSTSTTVHATITISAQGVATMTTSSK